jgi:micrococcal nuclease
MFRRIASAFFGAALLLPGAEGRVQAEVFRGPVQAEVIAVLDGDTFLANAHVWPGQFVRVNVRVRGMDAPEIHSRCPAEKRAALRARAALEELVGGGPVSISNIGGAKYYGRVLADVETADGMPVTEIMLARHLARPYSGGRRRPWC